LSRIDLPLSELRSYRPPLNEPHDFDDFWARSLAAARALGDAVRVDRVASPLSEVEVFDIRYPGYGGHPIAAWLIVPRGAELLPGVVLFPGYGGGRGEPHESLPWAASGFATLVVDVRGQGISRRAATPDPVPPGPGEVGFMTRGIHHPDTYYYRRVYIDAVRAVDALRTLPRVDPDQVSVAGTSQGGGIALAAAGLSHEVRACLSDVPFLCHFERSVGFADREPYAELIRHLRVYRNVSADMFRTLSYFDGVSMAARAASPALFSVALQDAVCPPSSVFAAYNAYAGPKEIAVFEFNEHEGGAGAHWPRQVEFLRSSIGQHG
jgi:cephalosporin-C deacetylase